MTSAAREEVDAVRASHSADPRADGWAIRGRGESARGRGESAQSLQKGAHPERFEAYTAVHAASSPSSTRATVGFAAP
jgi:hypothetical protein